MAHEHEEHKIAEEALEKVSGGKELQVGDMAYKYCKYCKRNHNLFYEGNNIGYDETGYQHLSCELWKCYETGCTNYYVGDDVI